MVVRYTETWRARVDGANAVVDFPIGPARAYHSIDNARRAAIDQRLPGFWRLKSARCA